MLSYIKARLNVSKTNPELIFSASSDGARPKQMKTICETRWGSHALTLDRVFELKAHIEQVCDNPDAKLG